MLKANTVPDCYDVLRVEALPDGDNCAVLAIGGDGDYDAYRALPRVVSIGGQVYTATGWNSDRGEAYYKRNRTIAKKV
jgi:hypothetical protein